MITTIGQNFLKFIEKIKSTLILDTNLSLDNVLNSGLYPLSPKGTVGLELIYVNAFIT